MVPTSGLLATAYSRFGIRPLHPDLATKALHHAITANAATLTIASIDWTQFTPTFTAAYLI